MPDKYFLSAHGPADALQAPDERVLWSGRCAVAEYAFEEPASLPRWTLPEETEVVVTDQRVVYRDPITMGTGELRWPWPQHLRVQPGNRDTGRSATVTQIQLVCAGSGESFPALVFAGGDLTTVSDADRLANLLRQAIARYRVEHAHELGISSPQGRMLSRLVIGPEFSNYQGGEGQTVSLLGAQSVGGNVPVSAVPVQLISQAPIAQIAASAPVSAGRVQPGQETTVLGWNRETPAAWDAPAPASAWDTAETPRQHAWQPEPELQPRYGWDAEVDDQAAATQPLGWSEGSGQSPARLSERQAAPEPPEPEDLASRAADLAARVAMLVSSGIEFDRYEAKTTNLSTYLGPDEAANDEPGEFMSRAEAVRRTAARLSGNSARGRGTPAQRRAEDEIGPRTR